MEADKLDWSDTNELDRIRHSKAQRPAVSTKKVVNENETSLTFRGHSLNFF